MRKTTFFILTCLLGTLCGVKAQTDYTNKIANPGFETGSITGWTWTGTTGYTWVGVNTDGDATKTGTYIAGTWNATFGDVELSQIITGLPNGMYKITADLMGSSNATTSRLTTQRLFANGVSMLFGAQSAYSAANRSVLDRLESYSFGGYAETQSDAGPFKPLTVTAPVTNGTLTLGVRTNGKASASGFTFPGLTAGNGHGWFKVDNFTLTYMGELTPEVTSNALLRNIKVPDGVFSPAFDSNTSTYTVTLPVGLTTITPVVVPAVPGVTITGNGQVDISSGTGVSVITVKAVDGTTTQTYTLNYKVENPFHITGVQQERLYTDEFPLSDVSLLDGPFKHARDLNIETLLKYDVNRLLAPYRKEAGLTVKATSYANWIGLDGHVGGHYLTALAINYAATGNTACKNLMDYMVTELKSCQDANTVKYPAWGVGYAGGVPNSVSVWSTFKTGNFSAYNSAWVPWYNLHKTYAGLRDAWLYGGNETAKTVFVAFCDWAISITSGLSDAQMETMLNIEHGGMNEVLADAYQITGNARYLTAAKRFSHKALFNSMSASSDNLDNMHANTQVPKAVGFQRIAEVSKDAAYTRAGQFFWQTVTTTRSLASGGNSRKEYFPQASACMDYINDVEGPESCNTNNMLKLSEDLFRISPQAKYADYFERALYNHILSTQHPEHGGFVYFTPARPRHYRVYSAPNQAMWCCVGTGMENHGKYGEFIYTHRNDSLYLNLFMASELNWKAKGVKVRQETSFPEEEKTRLVITSDAPTAFTLMVRSPKWVKAGALKIVVNTDTLAVVSQPQSYIGINRTWSNGDSVRILLPMQNTIEQLPNVPSYVAVMHGPVLLGAKTGTEELAGLIADDSRWGHIANGRLLSTSQSPMFVTDSKASIPSAIVPVEGKPLNFKVRGLLLNKADSSLVLEPFYKIHDARYMMYWMTLSQSEAQNILDSLAVVEKEALELEARTVDKVAPGEQQPEVDHKMLSLNSYTGNYMNEFWRDARSGGYVSYNMLTQKKSDLSLMVRYWGNETGSRSFDILIDGVKLTTENIVGKWNKNEFVNMEYPVPDSMTIGKDTITVKFQAINTGNMVGGLFYVRILQPLNTSEVITPKASKNGWSAYGHNSQIILTGLPESATVRVYDVCGRLLSQTNANQSTLTIPCAQKGLKLIRVTSEGKSQTDKVLIP